MKCIGAERNLYFRNEPNLVESNIAQPPWKFSHDKAVAQPITRQSSKSPAEFAIRAFHGNGAPVNFADGHQTFRGEHAIYFRECGPRIWNVEQHLGRGYAIYTARFKW